MRRLMYSLMTVLALHACSFADPDATSDRLGKVVEARLDGGKSLADLKGPKGTVVVFLSFECPNSNGYIPTLIDLHQAYSAKQIAFVGICENDLTADELKQKVAEFKLPFPVVRDPKQLSADAFKAIITPEAFLLDHNLVLKYRGRIDNQYSARLKKNATVTEHDLKNAIEDLVAGKPVKTPVTKAVGCLITSKETAVRQPTTLTYHKDVLPILQKNCQGCHRPGEVGPFSLMTFKQAVNWAEDIREYTLTRKMPPWKPNEGVAFHNDRRLSDAEIKTLASWVDGGTPEGNPADAPKPLQFTEGWMLGKPDLILTAKDDYDLGPSGPDSFRCYVLPTNLMEDKYIIGFEVKPGNPKIVHHTLNYWDITGKAREMELAAKEKAKPDDRDHGPGYSAAMGVGFFPTGSPRPGVPAIGNFGGWAPGQLPRFLPEGTGYLLPKGADVVMQVHYHRNGKAEKDRTQLGLYFAKKPVDRPFQTRTVNPRGFILIPPNKDDYTIGGTSYAHSDATLHSVMPHMHLIGKSVKITMTPPEGKMTTLVDIKEWDYNWQETYWLKEPMSIKAGTKFEIEAIFDNSTRNPNNPRNPPAYVIFGEQTHNEMLFGFLGFTHPEIGRNVIIRANPFKEKK
jgi:thiol-disulfide isomerase/thioredoxin